MFSMNKPSVPLGLVFSRSGPYAMMAGEMLNGAVMAVGEVNQSEEFDFTFTPHLRDPGGVVFAYHSACEELIREEGVDHIVGCYTSASRKQVLPIVERTDRLLWHPARYEGFESSDNVIYVGAAPNHNVIPLVRYMLGHIARDVFCVGSNYVWTWETNRVMREIVTGAGGHIIAERLLDLGETTVGHMVSSARLGRDHGRAHGPGDRETQAAGRVQHARRRIQLPFHSRASRGDGERGSSDTDVELQPVRAGTQTDRIGRFRRMHSFLSVFRKPRTAGKPLVRRKMEAALRRR